MQEITIGGRKIASGAPPWIVAEMSGNHNQSLERALQIVEAAAKAGAHALKLQTFQPDTITLNVNQGEFYLGDPDNLWAGTTLYQLAQQAYTPWEWHQPIFDRCRELGMIGFSTPFDETAVDFLETLGVEVYKVASFENVHLPLIRKIAATGKPMIISTGMASIAELDEAVAAARQAGCEELVLLKCTSTYPASPENSNLLTLPHLRDLFNVPVGISDHTLGIGVAVASVALGATVIEKHFTLRRADGGLDAAFSMEPEEMTQLVLESARAAQSLGKISYGPTEPEKAAREYRRSLYISQAMQAGETFTTQNLKVVRPGLGIAPKHYETILGKTINQDAPAGTALKWELIG
jgi:pseudaminic acid synthase